MAKLTLKKRDYPPSAATEGDDLTFRPMSYTRPPPPSNWSRVLVLLVVLIVLTGILVGRAYLKYSESLNERRLNVLFARDGAQLVEQVFSALDREEINLLARTKAFTLLAESHTITGNVGAPIAARATELGSLLMTASQTRENYSAVRNRVLSAPPSVMDRYDPETKSEEQERRLSFLLDQSVNRPWNKYVNDRQGRALFLVGEIERMEAAFSTPLVGWARWVSFVQHIWNSDPMFLSVKYYLGVEEPQPEVPKKPCVHCLDKKRVTCSSCKGRGSLSQTTSEACEQCKGSGRYVRKLSKTTASCPFCNGRGQIISSASKTCSTCDGTGVVRCTACAQVADH